MLSTAVITKDNAEPVLLMALRIKFTKTPTKYMNGFYFHLVR